MKDETADTFGRAVRDVELCGFLQRVEPIDRGVFVAHATQGWDEVAANLAGRLRGMLFASRSGAGLSWVCGGGKSNPGPHGVIVCPNSLQTVRRAREVAYDLSVAQFSDKPLWSVGAVCRCLLSWVTETDGWYDETSETLLKDVTHGYHCCYPGEYKDDEEGYRSVPMRDLFADRIMEPNPAYKPAVTLYDVSGYYYTMLTRLRSLKVSFSRNQKRPVRQFLWSKNEAAKWKDLLAAIEDNKPLRNTLTGVCLGSLNPFHAWTGSKPRPHDKPERLPVAMVEERGKLIRRWKEGDVRRVTIPGSPGPWRNAGLLVVRTGYELAAMEALQNKAIYGTIDSVALTTGKPSVWPGRGFTITKKAEGSGVLCHRGSYSIGQKQTKPYARGERTPVLVERAELPDTLYCNHWL